MTVAARPTVVVADDLDYVADFLLRVVSMRYQGIGEVYSLRTLGRVLRDDRPDIALVDVRMQEETSTLDVLPELMEMSPSTRFILITGYPEWAPAGRVFAQGAKGLIAKPFVPQELWRAIDVVYSGGSYLSESLLVRGVTRVVRPSKPLSEGQAKVFALLRQGCTYAQIEARLGISESTIGKHVHVIREKLGIAHESSYTHWPHFTCVGTDF